MKNTLLTDEDKTQLTARFAIRISKFIRAGKYRLAALLMSRHVEGITLSAATKRIRRDRIAMRHRLHVGGVSSNGRTSHWPHCECGWSGEEILETVKSSTKNNMPNSSIRM